MTYWKNSLWLPCVLAAVLLSACDETPTSPSENTPPPSGGGGGGGGVPSSLTISMVRGATNLTTTAYAPNPVGIRVGGTVTWTNNDLTAHDATAENKAFATGIIGPGASATVTLNTPGRITYYCTLHPGMTGTLEVQ